eukprot:1148520-Pelagomonas_calceolata.AAC.7
MLCGHSRKFAQPTDYAKLSLFGSPAAAVVACVFAVHSCAVLQQHPTAGSNPRLDVTEGEGMASATPAANPFQMALHSLLDAGDASNADLEGGGGGEWQ